MFACIYRPQADRERLLDCAWSFSPRVEETGPGTVLVDLDGLERLAGSSQDVAEAIARKLGGGARVAVASNPDAAVHAAQGLAGITVILPGQEAERLGSLPLALLAPPPEIAETFEMWGLRRFRDLAALPEAGLVERMGAEGVRLQRLARGAGNRRLIPASPPARFEESLELDHPVETLEPLSFLLARLLEQLCRRVRAILELRLRLGLDNGAGFERVLRLPFPTRDHRSCWKLLQLDLEAHPPGAPIVEIHLEAVAGEPRIIQQGLFVPLAPEPERLEVTLARIGKLVGTGNVGSVELMDTHRPGAFRMKRFHARGSATAPVQSRDRQGAVPKASPAVPQLALRLFRPPLRAELRGRRIVARGVKGEILAQAGPWRSSGDWWTSEAWGRDEWDVALSDGALYRIYRDRPGGAWFIEGSYD